MSGKRKPLLRSPNDSNTSSSGDEGPPRTDAPCLKPSRSGSGGSGRRLVKQDLSSTSVVASQVNEVLYDNAASPSGSSTASGPIYVRPPGFKHHGQEVTVKSLSNSGGKKKKALVVDSLPKPSPLGKFHWSKASVGEPQTPLTSVSGHATVGHTKPKNKREPLPMKLRALPQSFWQQPNATINVSPGQMYAKLPPLISKDSQDVTDIRPVTPPEEREKGNSGEMKDSRRIIRVSNTDWLYKLFANFDGREKIPAIKRGRPKKQTSTHTHLLRDDEDPCVGRNIGIEALELPLLSSDKTSQTQPTLTMISLRDRDKSVSLPALHIERNYSQLLSELVVKL